jgi:DnaJ-class molecular chaperone
MDHSKQCDHCHKDCLDCNGTGMVTRTLKSGTPVEDICQTCHGDGRVPKRYENNEQPYSH